jgi:hypothetical protein
MMFDCLSLILYRFVTLRPREHLKSTYKSRVNEVQLLEALQWACSELRTNTVGQPNTPSVHVEINLISVRVEAAHNMSPISACG